MQGDARRVLGWGLFPSISIFNLTSIIFYVLIYASFQDLASYYKILLLINNTKHTLQKYMTNVFKTFPYSLYFKALIIRRNLKHTELSKSVC